MAILKRLIGTVAIVGVGLGTAYGQTPPTEAEQIRARQQIVLMETVLVGAISNGAQNVIREVRRVTPEYRPRTVPARVTGVRLPGYGILFNVDVPMIPMPILWDVRLLEMQTNALMRIQQLRTEALNMPEGPDRSQLMSQANQLQQDLALGNLRATQPSRGTVAASSLVSVGVNGRSTTSDPGVLDDPESAYTREVKAALIDAMLNSSPALGVKADEWLTIVARDGAPTNPQSPADVIDTSVQVMRVKGSTLAAFQARTITGEEARKLVEVTEQ